MGSEQQYFLGHERPRGSPWPLLVDEKTIDKLQDEDIFFMIHILHGSIFLD